MIQTKTIKFIIYLRVKLRLIKLHVNDVYVSLTSIESPDFSVVLATNRAFHIVPVPEKLSTLFANTEVTTTHEC